MRCAVCRRPPGVSPGRCSCYHAATRPRSQGRPCKFGPVIMPTVITERDEITIPEWVNSLEAFRRWTDQDDFPESGRIWWLRGRVWADMSKEQIFSHLAVKTEYTVVLGGLAKSKKLGLYLGDGLLLSNFAADISGNPDGTFVSNDTLASDRVRLIEGARGGYTEIQGSPDMVLEIVSDSSVHKDLDVLRQEYWDAA